MQKDMEDKAQAAQLVQFIHRHVDIENIFSWRSVVLDTGEVFVYVFVEPIKGDPIKLICNASGGNVFIFVTEYPVDEIVSLLIGMYRSLRPGYGKTFSLGECIFSKAGYPYGLLLVPDTLGLLEKVPHRDETLGGGKNFYLFMPITAQEHQIAIDKSLDDLLGRR